MNGTVQWREPGGSWLARIVLVLAVCVHASWQLGATTGCRAVLPFHYESCEYHGEEGGGCDKDDCWDKVDNDGDGKIDCADPDCCQNPECCQDEPLVCCETDDCKAVDTCPASEPAEDCGNDQDDDQDGLIDCADLDACCTSIECSQEAACEDYLGFEQCTDGKDNDGDGLVDCADDGCANVAPCDGTDPAYGFYTCTADLQDCALPAVPLGSADLSVTVTGSLATETELGNDCYQAWGENVTCAKPESVHRSLYCDRGGRIVSCSTELLDGAAHVVRTFFRDADNENAAFLTLSLKDWCDVYLAFDGRVQNAPPWLAQLGFEQVATVPTTLALDTGKVDFTLYVKRTVKGTLVLPGNAYQHANVWPAGFGPGKNELKRAMYSVLIKRLGTTPDCATIDGMEQIGHEGCYKTEGLAKLATQTRCLQARTTPAQVCAAVVCDPPTDCPGGAGSHSAFFTAHRSFRRGSKITFLPQSTIKMLVDGKQYSRAIVGGVDFSVDRATGDLTLHRLSADLGTLQNLQDVKVYLAQPAVAKCGDQIKGVPCVTYEIPMSAFRAMVTARDGNAVDFMPAVNGLQGVSVTVFDVPPSAPGGKPRKRVHIEGKLDDVRFQINGDDKVASVMIDLYAEFDFAAAALPAEWTVQAECAADRNSVPIELQAHSADPDDVLPDQNYAWYENYGWVGQRLLGHGLKQQLPPGTLSFGTHQVTLLVRDALGVDTKTFALSVVDTLPPTLDPRPPVYRLVPPGGTSIVGKKVKVDIGSVGIGDAYDKCALRGAWTAYNDGPDDGLFALGYTPVTWWVDDGYGNVSAPEVQDVYVLAPSQSWVWTREKLVELGDFARRAVRSAALAVERCEPTRGCAVDVEPALKAIKQLQVVLSGSAGTAPSRGDEVTREALEAGASALRRARRYPRRALGEDTAARARALAELERAEQALNATLVGLRQPRR